MGLFSKLRKEGPPDLSNASRVGGLFKLNNEIIRRGRQLSTTNVEDPNSNRVLKAGNLKTLAEKFNLRNNKFIKAGRLWMFGIATETEHEASMILRSVVKRDSADLCEKAGAPPCEEATIASRNEDPGATTNFPRAHDEERLKRPQLPRLLHRSANREFRLSEGRLKRHQRAGFALKRRNADNGIRQTSAKFSAFSEETQHSSLREHPEVQTVDPEAADNKSRSINFPTVDSPAEEEACSVSLLTKLFAQEQQKTTGKWKLEKLEKLLPVSETLLLARSERKMAFVKDLEVRISKLDPHAKLLKKLKPKLFASGDRVRIELGETAISTHTPSSEFPRHVEYCDVIEIVRHLGPHHRSRFIYLTLTDGFTYAIKLSSYHQREQWVQWLHCRMILLKSKQILHKETAPERKYKAIQRLVNYTIAAPFRNDELVLTVVDMLVPLLRPDMDETLLQIVSPLLTVAPPSQLIYSFLSAYCLRRSKSELVPLLLKPVVERILKRVDFYKYPSARTLAQDFFGALFSQDNGKEEIVRFVGDLHGHGSNCPHPRVLNNLVAIGLASLHMAFQENEMSSDLEPVWDFYGLGMLIMKRVAAFGDWRPTLAAILQPVPFDQSAIKSRAFLVDFAEIFRALGTDGDCNAHKLLLSVREDKDGWFDIYDPTRHDMEEAITSAFVDVLTKLCTCCFERRKCFASRLDIDLLQALSKSEAWIAHELLTLALEYNMVKGRGKKAEVASTLHATAGGRAAYAEMFQRGFHHNQQAGKPGALTELHLPPRTTDNQFAEVVNSNNCGSLESVSLAFTHVTSASAEHLIRMVELKQLNLWATRIDDDGVERIAEHLEGLEELNLCETPVTDKGIRAVAALKQLRKLHLSNTSLSHDTREFLKRSLPNLTDIDDRYTPAFEERMAMMARAASVNT